MPLLIRKKFPNLNIRVGTPRKSRSDLDQFGQFLARTVGIIEMEISLHNPSRLSSGAMLPARMSIVAHKAESLVERKKSSLCPPFKACLPGLSAQFTARGRIDFPDKELALWQH
jgi:hypothetical protein